MKVNSVKGTSDYLPREAALREYIQSSILTTYQSHGFQQIMTPALEDIENLDKSEGGDNLNLIFKILKRGDKLSQAIESARFDSLADMGLRYDLTLPLSRFYANNRQHLILPFKCIQIDKVYRAEKPQKGRMRELIQCDIDIIGSQSICCEIELIHVTAEALLALGLENFTVHINNRKVLKGILLSLGFGSQELDSVCITFDKFDKIGIEGVRQELSDKGFAPEAIDALSSLLQRLPLPLQEIKGLSEESESIKQLEEILTQSRALAEGRYDIVFDLSLVRGQGYYSGTVFEIDSKDFSSSIAGGGRYDHLIGKFLDQSVPAVGFSIGFERIFSIFMEGKLEIPFATKKLALFYEEDFVAAARRAQTLRKEYDVSLFERPKKLGKFLDALKANGFYGFMISNQEGEVKLLK